jgi:hypothetical protein
MDEDKMNQNKSSGTPVHAVTSAGLVGFGRGFVQIKSPFLGEVSAGHEKTPQKLRNQRLLRA